MGIYEKGSRVCYLGREYIVEYVKQKNGVIIYGLYRLAELYNTYGTPQQEKETKRGHITEVEITEANKDIIKPIKR